jgi:hypothetical protein
MCAEATDIAGAIAAGNSKGLRRLLFAGSETRIRLVTLVASRFAEFCSGLLPAIALFSV